MGCYRLSSARFKHDSHEATYSHGTAPISALHNTFRSACECTRVKKVFYLLAVCGNLRGNNRITLVR